MRIALIVAIIAALVVFGCQNAVNQQVQTPPPAPQEDARASDVAAIEQTVSADDIAAIEQDISDLDSLGSDLEPSEFDVDTQI